MRLITYDNGPRFELGKFTPIKNAGWIKPYGGLWSSPIDSVYGWKEWRQETGFDRPIAESFIFDYSGHILRIDTRADMDLLDWIAHPDGLWDGIDFEAMARRGIDAIHLTVDGEQATNFHACYPSHKNLCGWDCESVLIMNPLGVRELEPCASIMQ